MKTGEKFQFGKFQVDTLARTLRREQEIVTLNRRAFDVLLYFVQNPGKVLTREELLKNVWAEAFVDENSLAQSISVLRRALEEKPGDNSYIVTLPGRGYQFVSAVQVVASENEDTLPQASTDAGSSSSRLLFQKQTIQTSVTTTDEKKELLSSPVSRSRPLVTLAALLVVAAASAGWYAWKGFHRAPPQMNPPAVSSTGAIPTARRSIAVLGFRNLSGRPQDGWLSTALAEMLSTELVAGEKLRLVSSEDIARTKLELPLADADSLSRDTLARLHRNLGSDLIVLGSYTALGKKPDTRIRLDLRLQDTADGETIADVAVVGSAGDLFGLASQAGSRLREKLGVEAISPAEAVSVRASLPSSRDAARLYSEGLARLRVFDALQARDLLQQAVAADPKFSLAHSALAEAWNRLGYNKKAQQEARQAYELSTNLSREEKLVVEGRYRDMDHENEKAIEIYRALFALFPDNLEYGLSLAQVQSQDGKGQDALATVGSLRKLTRPALDDPRVDLAEAAAWDAMSDYKHEEPPLARAAEMARAQGSRLILADAKQKLCWTLYRLGHRQDAIADCRESRDIFAAAGNQDGEATSLADWADAISMTDAPESIRLLQQAQIIFRRIGSELGLANALNDLGIVYAAQGNYVAAEKVYGEALAGYRLLDATRFQAMAIGNMANSRKAQGDLRGAAQLYEQTLQLAREVADTGIEAISLENLGDLHQSQGELAAAKQEFEQSLAVEQKTGNQPSSAYSMQSLGSVLEDQGDLLGARKMYDQALALWTSAADKLGMAQLQMSLADLSLEEKHSPVDQEAAARAAIQVFQQQESLDDEILARCILARALIAKGKTDAAKQAMQQARPLAAKSRDPGVRWEVAIVASRAETAAIGTARLAPAIAARKELAGVITKSRELGYLGMELEARLALAEIEMKAGQTAEGRAHLTAIEADAKAKGFNLVARKAAAARG